MEKFDIRTAPKDGTVVWLYIGEADGLPAFECAGAYSAEAGWLVDTIRSTVAWRPFTLADYARINRENAELRAAVRALADAAELLHGKLHIIQPYLAVFKLHGATIERARGADAWI